MAQKSILVIAPHADDEVLGCGAYLYDEANAGSDIHIVVGTIGGTDKRQSIEVRNKELEKVCAFLKASFEVLFTNQDAYMDMLPDRDVISEIDYIVDRIKPDVILINCWSHHQDHKKIYECAMASCRQREGFRPKMVMLYEYPCLEPGVVINGGRCYHSFDEETLKAKKDMLSMYPSQIRQEPSPINHKGIESLAMIRGRECGCEYAELFYVQRMTV